jgi:hypothetical protein
MLPKIVELINSSNPRIENGTLFCDNYIITDLCLIDYIESVNAFENIINKQVGNIVNLELSLVYLKSIGYYEDCETFVLKNRYCIPSDLYYINEIECYSSSSNDFISKFNSVIKLVDSIKKISKHTYTDADIDNSIVFKEERSVFLPFIYDASDVKLIKKDDVDAINSISQVLEDSNSEKKLLFINELVDFLSSKEENGRFKFLLSQLGSFSEKCNNAYQFYLRDFSYNKLKIELDSKALEYTQKIQTVINESQTKLIAIPTAFVLVFATFDFEDLFSIKNIASILSLFVFAILIQLFLNNQKSTLSFIWENVLSYKGTFSDTNIETISSKFILLEKELKKQRTRLNIVQAILWLIPIILAFFWLYLVCK